MIDWASVGVAFITIFTGFFACLTAYSLRDFSRSRLKEICEEKNREERFGEILKSHDPAIVVADLVVLILAIGASVLWVVWFQPRVVGDPAETSIWISALMIIVIVMLLGFSWVILPWTVSRVRGETWLYRCWPMLNIGLRATRPILNFIERFDLIAHRLTGLPEPDADGATVLTEEIRTVVDEGQREGVLLSEARTMIHRVMELKDEDAAAIMTPRTDMVSIHVDASLEEARETMLECGHSRVPVIAQSTDDVVGILHAKDLLKHLPTKGEGPHPLKSILREPFYIPETTSIDSLLETMRRDHVHIAIVLDEYSGVSGIVTMEDILEEIVGDIVDEYDADETEGIEVQENGEIVVEGRVHIDDLNERFPFDLPEDGDFDTIGGFVLAQFARVPLNQEVCKWRHLSITVLEADKRKLHLLRIHVDPKLTASSEDK